MIKTQVLMVVLLTLTASLYASDFRLEYDAGTGRAVIWIEAEDYDSKTAEFVQANPLEMAYVSGKAYYFPQNSPREQVDEWWAEYSIDQAAVHAIESNVDLTGTWYAWVRANQPQADHQEAHYLLVKGDPNNGSGPNWYAQAIASVDPDVTDAEDIIANDLAAAGGAGFGRWAWVGYTAGTGGVQKEFNLDENDKIVFRINSREGGPNSARVDVIAWTNDPTFVPNDADFGQVAVTNGLVLEMNAAYPGINLLDEWTPFIAADPFGRVATGEFREGQPVIRKEAGSESGKYIWYYEFDKDIVADIFPVHELSFGYDEVFTVEAWVRVPAKQEPDTAGRAVIIGNTGNNDTGWRFGVRDLDGQWRMEFNVRDNETDITPARGIISMNDNNVIDYSATEWVQIVGTRYEFDVTGGISVDFTFYINGQRVRYRTTRGLTVNEDTINNPSDFALMTTLGYAKLGSKNHNQADHAAAYSFVGDIALVRVYNRELSQAEVAANYTYGIEQAIESQIIPPQYDLNQDGIVDLEDFMLIAGQWLQQGWIITGE